MRFALLATLISIILLALSCGSTQETGAQEYTEAPEITALNDSIEAYEAVVEEPSFDEYREIFEHFLALYPKSTELHREFQDLLDGFGKTAEKELLYDSLHRANPESAMFSYLCGRASGGEISRKLIEEAVRLDPDYYWGHFGKAYIHLTSVPPDTDAAISEYQTCVQIDSQQPTPYRQLANLYAGRKNFEKALQAADALERITPDSFLPARLKAGIYRDMDNLGAAEEVLLAFAEANPKSQSVRRELIDIYEDTDRWEEVLVYRHQLLDLADDSSAALFDLSKAYVELGEPDSGFAYVAAATEKGFADFRRLSRNPALKAIRELEGYPGLLAEVKINADNRRQQRIAAILENEEEKKTEALAERLDVQAPGFNLSTLEGKNVALSDLRGNVVVLDFWATWCGPCRLTMPLLQQFVERKPDEVKFFSVNVWEDDTSLVRPFLAEYGYDFSVLFGDNSVPTDYGVTGIPTLFVIDKEGIIRYKHVGYSSAADLLLQWQTESLL